MPPPSAVAASEPELDAFVASRLGSAAATHLAQPVARRAVLERVRSGHDLEDAVLAELHAALPARPALADDFAAFLLLDLLTRGYDSMSCTSRLRRFLDTGDLALSVFGEHWHDIPAAHFESAAQMRALAAERLQRATAASVRRLPAPRPADGERARLILMLLRLPQADRDVLRLHLQGADPEAIARRLGLGVDVARRTLERALLRARQLACLTATPDHDDAPVA